MKKLLILLMLFAFPATAQELPTQTKPTFEEPTAVSKPVVCMKTAKFKMMAQKDELVPIALGLVNENLIMELYVNIKKREFSIIEHNSEDISCIISIGGFFDAQFKILMQEADGG